MVEALLTQKAEMLQEYVGITFLSQTGTSNQQQQQQTDHGQQQRQQQQGRCSDQSQQRQQQHMAGLPPGLYLTGLPLLLEGYVPDLSSLPQLILYLARDVDWDTEKECFKTLATVIADFYMVQPMLCNPTSAASCSTAASSKAKWERDSRHTGSVAADVPVAMDIDGSDDKTNSANAAAGNGLLAGHRNEQQRGWLLRHVLMPAVKFMLKPPQHRARDGSVLLLTSMEKLYRVFERCGW